ncbi:transporter [Sphingomonas sp. JC676]|uniref:transporter n=1 Tax=Sphingomonas sp. JC676 TaxID=2768065 RepID=UPI0016577CD6|nr:transporter [Sphingomonas sp. JC676]MBC9033914.1 transporter [Sphingomonas sp. JC676]
MKMALVCAVLILPVTTAQARSQDVPIVPRVDSIERRLDQALDLIEAQRRRLDAQEVELKSLRAELLASAASPAPAPASPTVPGGQALERVGQAPADEERPIELAVLDGQGSIITRAGQLTGELQLDYARADRSRAIFRGIELVEVVLVGVFDINESRQDVLTGSAALRYGVTDRFELGIRMPYVYRSDASIIAPVSGTTPDDSAATIDSSAKGNGIGDLELTARYQLTGGGSGWPYLIGNLQAVLPTGSDPFAVPRDELGRALRAATGAGFYGISPSVTAILPSDPVVLFATAGYTFNLGKDVNTQIPPVIINHVDPGDALSFSAGIGVSFNQRTTINLGYAHSWVFGTRTSTSLIDPTPQWPGERVTRSRDLQIGRLLLGITYRMSDRASLNWSVEVGATEDATDLRTVLRVPFVLLTGG